MKSINITINKNQISDKPMRNILGMNNLPRITSVAVNERDKGEYKALNIKHIRHHDAPIENPSKLIADIHCIFPLFHLDETKEENYNFDQTDDYFGFLEGSDAEIDFRLGETIDHSQFKRNVSVPEDTDKWARICRNIIGHYKNGEMNGMKLNIRRVTVWEEPDNGCLFSGSVEEYSEMFCKVYRLIKADFPDIMVGGPTTMIFGYEFLEQFLEICKKNGVTPDYVSTTMYCRKTDDVIDEMMKYKEIMDKAGFPGMRYVLSEWHFGVHDWNRTAYMSENDFEKVQSAAYSSALLTRLMDIDFLDAAYFYAWAVTVWGMKNVRRDDNALMPVYYGLMFFQKLAAECGKRFETESEENTFTYVLSGETGDGKTRVLISCFDGEDCVYNVNVNGADTAVIRNVDSCFREEDAVNGKTIKAKDGVFTVECKGGNGVYLLEI